MTKPKVLDAEHCPECGHDLPAENISAITHCRKCDAFVKVPGYAIVPADLVEQIEDQFAVYSDVLEFIRERMK